MLSHTLGRQLSWSERQNQLPFLFNCREWSGGELPEPSKFCLVPESWKFLSCPLSPGLLSSLQEGIFYIRGKKLLNTHICLKFIYHYHEIVNWFYSEKMPSFHVCVPDDFRAWSKISGAQNVDEKVITLAFTSPQRMHPPVLSRWQSPIWLLNPRTFLKETDITYFPLSKLNALRTKKPEKSFSMFYTERTKPLSFNLHLCKLLYN